MNDLTVCPQCHEPAEVRWRAVLDSTDGPIEHARILCLRSHCFFVPVESLPEVRAPVRPERAGRHGGGAPS